MRVLHGLSGLFDDPNLVSFGGLAPVLALAERAGLHCLVGEHVRIDAAGGVNSAVKVPALIGGMIAGADSIDDMDLLRHGGMRRLFAGLRAPSTLGTFLRAFTFGHVQQLDAVASRLLGALAGLAPLLPGADRIAYVDIDDTVKATYGYAKQGAGYGYSGVKGLNALIATLATPLAAPVIVAARLRKGATNSARGTARLVVDAVRAAHGAGATGLVVLRADSAFYHHDVIAAAHRAGAYFSVTARHDPAVLRAIDAIEEHAWMPIRYPNAIYDEAEGRWISDAQVAEIHYTAFTSRRRSEHIDGRLIVRRVRRLGVTAVSGQGELLAAWRHHAVFTDSPLIMLQAETAHRGHAIIEQVHADLRAGPLAHLRAVHRERRLAGPGDDRVQPHPRRRHPRFHVPRQGHHRHDPSTTDQRAGAAGPLRPTSPHAPAAQLALGTRLATVTRRRRARPTPHSLTRHPTGRRPQPETTVDAGHPGRTAMPNPTTRSITRIHNCNDVRRWIQAEPLHGRTTPREVRRHRSRRLPVADG